MIRNSQETLWAHIRHIPKKLETLVRYVFQQADPLLQNVSYIWPNVTMVTTFQVFNLKLLVSKSILQMTWHPIPINMPLCASTCTGPMLPASDQYRPGTGNLWHVYRDTILTISMFSMSKQHQ